MRHATDAMHPAVTLDPATSIPDLAKTLLQAEADGVCVVDEDGKLLGVVTAMDLVFREAPVHAPAYVALFDLVLGFGQEKTKKDLARIQAQTAGELMTHDVRIATPETRLMDVAGWMRDEHLSMIPVVWEGDILGVVTRRSMVQHTLSHFTRA
jgi:signal-transduction protein with cAMP-binding, CBS, and nucleotidyltransferase domain